MKNLLIVILLLFTISLVYTGHTVRERDIREAAQKTTTQVQIVSKEIVKESSKIVTKKQFFTFCSEVADAYVKFFVGIHDNITKE